MNNADVLELAASATFLKVGHHGSHNATPIHFINEHLPTKTPAVISTQVGPGNYRNGIPPPKLLATINTRKMTFVRRDRPPKSPKGIFTPDPKNRWVDCVVPVTGGEAQGPANISEQNLGAIQRKGDISLERRARTVVDASHLAADANFLHRRKKQVHPQTQFLAVQLVQGRHRLVRVLAVPAQQLTHMHPVLLFDVRVVIFLVRPRVS